MTLGEKAKFLRATKQKILTMWCPWCWGQIVRDEVPDRWIDRRMIRTPPMLCLDCDRRMGPDRPRAWFGTTITALEWGRAEWTSQTAGPRPIREAINEVLKMVPTPSEPPS